MINEAFEVHNELNPKIWASDNTILPDVNDKLLEIVDEFKNNLVIPIDIVDVHIVGSNASYNYTDKSDLDLHIIANFEFLDIPIDLAQSLYDCNKRVFNDKYDLSIHGINVELYVEDVRSTNISNGIYSLYQMEWIKFPKKLEDIPHINVDYEVSRLVDRANKLIDKGESSQIRDLINQVYLIRKNSLTIDGEYGKGNLIFKDFRNSGMLDVLKNELYKARSKELSLQEKIDNCIIDYDLLFTDFD